VVAGWPRRGGGYLLRVWKSNCGALLLFSTDRVVRRAGNEQFDNHRSSTLIDALMGLKSVGK
jgi:hypothetical protein